MMSASKTLKKNLSIAVATVFLVVAAFSCWAIEPSKAYADTTGSHLTVASEVHVLVDSEGNVTIPNATVTNDGTCAAYIMGCSSPDGLGWTCDAVGKRIEVGQSITATWRSAGPVSDEIAAQLGEEPYYAGNLTYTYTDGDLKGTVSLDNTDPTVGDTITATVTGANVPDDKLTYQWYRVKDGVEAAIDGATGSTYTATDDDAGYELVCKVSSTDDICQGTICGATGAVKKIQAFAVYSADDGSLSFYKRAGMPSAGEQFEGKTATAVYTGIEKYSGSPWEGYASKIKTATVVDDGLQPYFMDSWFFRCKSMTACDLRKLNTSNVVDMNWMFNSCSSLTTIGDLSNWDTSKVTDMGNMFNYCSKLTSLDLSNWDTTNVTNMIGMFIGCTKLQEATFGENWKWVGTNGYLPTPSSTYITGADGKWYDTDGNAYAPADIPSNKAMTYYASKDLLPQAFAVYSADDQSLNFYKRSGVPSAGEQFNGKTATAVYTGIETMTNRPWSGYASKIKTATVIDDGIRPCKMNSWFNGCYTMTACDLGKLDTSKATDIGSLFDSCSSLTSLNISSWNTSNITNMSYMFSGCTNLTSIGNLSSWNTSNVTNMRDMFSYCSSLTSLGDLSSWNTSKVTNMRSTFYGCFKLSADCSNWDVSKVTDHRYFNADTSGVILPLAWQTSSDEGVKDSTIAPLCEEQGNGDALNVSDENGNDEATSKMDGKASPDSETEGSTTTSATDEAGAKEEEASGDIVQEEPAAA